MSKEKKINNLREYGEYLSQGIEEVGKDYGLNTKANLIISQQRGKMPDAVFVLQSFAQKVAHRKNYSANTFRVMLYFFGLSEYENFVSVDVKTISEWLDISEVSVKRATKQLTDDNILIKTEHPSDKRRIDYFLNPMASWRGKTMNRDKAIEKLQKKNKAQLDMFTND
jgi:DNA-binding MarR family transcriptional regulator